MNNFTKLLCVAALTTGATQAASAQILYDNFENTRIVSYPLVEGTLVQNAANPGTNAVNSSSTCASYARQASAQYAVLVVRPVNARMASVAAYTTGGTKRISVKFRSPAAGVTVGVVLQNSRLNTSNYPTGKFGTEFTAVTTVANAWETLTFTPTPASGGNFDATVTATDIDQMLFQVAPNSNNASTYYLDDIMGPELVAVVPTAPAVRQLYDNYEGTRAIKYIAPKTSGGLRIDTLNNSVSAGNLSARVARYTRSNNLYDVLVMHPRGAALADVSNFKNTTATALHMTLKVFSVVPGVFYQITLQDSTVAGATNYPAGRNSEYTATTTATNAWETLSFDFANAPSPAMPNTGLNEIVLLIAPNTTVRRKVYLDDFFGPSLVGFVSATRTVQTASAAFAPAYPNPTSGLTQLPFSLQKPAVVSLTVFDNVGRRVAQLIDGESRAAGQYTAELNAAKLAPGLYTCRLTVDGVALSRPLSVE